MYSETEQSTLSQHWYKNNSKLRNIAPFTAANLPEINFPLFWYTERPTSLHKRWRGFCSWVLLCYKQLFTNTCIKCKQFWQKERNNIVFQNIDLSYSLIVFFVLCTHLRQFWTIFNRLAPFWCSAAKTDFLLAVEQENSTNSLKMPQNSLRNG